MVAHREVEGVAVYAVLIVRIGYFRVDVEVHGRLPYGNSGVTFPASACPSFHLDPSGPKRCMQHGMHRIRLDNS